MGSIHFTYRPIQYKETLAAFVHSMQNPFIRRFISLLRQMSIYITAQAAYDFIHHINGLADLVEGEQDGFGVDGSWGINLGGGIFIQLGFGFVHFGYHAI